MPILFITVSSAILIFLITIIIFSFVSGDKNRVLRRLQAISDYEENPKPQHPKKQQSGRKIRVSKTFSEQLLSAGIRMRPEEFLAFWLISAIAPAGLLLLAQAHPITVFFVALLGVAIPPLLIIRARKKRVILFEKQLGDALLLMGNCLRSGMTFQQAMVNIAKDMPDPVSREFARTVKEIRLGNSMEEALNNMVRRLPSTDLMLMVSAVQIQRQAGGNLLDILENISITIKDRLKLRDDIRVMTSSGRISSIVIGMLPVVIAGALMLINPAYIQTFFETSMGTGMLIGAGVMEGLGFLFIKKIVTIKY